MRLMSGRLRPYAATIPATVPMAKSTSMKTAIARSRQMRAARLRRLFFGISDGAEHSVHETSGVFRGETLGEGDGLVDRACGRRLRAAVHFEGRHFEQQAIDRRKPFERPAFQERAHDAIGLLGVFQRAQRQLLDESPLLAIGVFANDFAQCVLRFAVTDYDAVEDLKRLLARGPARRSRRHRSASSLERNSTSYRPLRNAGAARISIHRSIVV